MAKTETLTISLTGSNPHSFTETLDLLNNTYAQCTTAPIDDIASCQLKTKIIFESASTTER